jgi:endoglucanase
LTGAAVARGLSAPMLPTAPPPMKLLPSMFLSALLLSGALVAQTKPSAEIIRIKTGVSTPLTDETGVVWLADSGFVDGDTIDRPGIAIGNTKTPSLYQAERYAMTAFRWKLPNGKYTLKLHFAETYEGIYAPGERVFSFNVEGTEFKDFDVWKKAGGAMKAYIETVQVEVTDGTLDITFTPKVENPQVNALEIIPAG